MARFKRLKTVLVLALSALALYVGLLNLLDRLEWKRPSDGLLWTQAEQGVILQSFLADSSDRATDLAVGDRLISINGIRIKNLNEYTEVLELLAETLAAAHQATYVVQRPPTNRTISRQIEISLTSAVDSIDILLALVAFAHLGIGVFIFLRHAKSNGAFHFYVITLVAFVLYLYRYSGRADAFDVLIYWCGATAFLILPPLFLHFCCYFPEPISLVRKLPSLKSLVYFPSLVLLALHALWFSGQLKPIGLPRTPLLGHLWDQIHLAHFIGLFLVGILVLVQSYRESSWTIQRMQMKWVTWGTATGVLPFAILYALPYVLGFQIPPLLESSVLTLVLVPLSFGYGVAKYRVRDVEVIFKQGAAYVLASSALLGLYLGIVLLLTRAIHGFPSQSGFLLFALSALFVAFLFAPLKNVIQEHIDRYFYREAYDYRRSLADFGRTLGADVRISSLAERISDRLQKTLHVAPVAIFLRDQLRSNQYVLFHSEGPSFEHTDTAPVLTVPDSIFSDFDRELKPIFVSPRTEEVEQFKKQLSRWNFHYVQPLRVRGRVIGFLALGKRLHRQLLSSEDLDLIATLSGYAAIAIDNALLYRSLEGKAAELEQLKAYSENVVESIAVGIMAVTPDGEITVWNHALEKIVGLSATEAIGKKISQVLPEDPLKTLSELVDAPRWVVDETSHLYKTHIHSHEGAERLVNITISPFVLQDDVITGTLFVFDDVTDKIRLQNQLLQAEKLSSIGLLAAGIAHEVNTPLAAISSYTQMLLKEVQPDDGKYEILEKIERQSFRASSIVNNLLNFARVDDSDFHQTNVNTLMIETLSLLDHQLKKANLDVRLRLDPALPQTWANESKLQQVFMNLFLNARDAMPDGGRLSIETYREDSAIVIEIQDTGVGISETNIKRIYDPFFTTKEVGEGTGLGLSVSYGIIQEHSGRINVKSEPGRGTTFQLHLPVKHIQ